MAAATAALTDGGTGCGSSHYGCTVPVLWLQVLRLLKKHPHVRLSLHAHVHANTLTVRHGVVFASSASAAEFPMQWREVHVLPCEVRLRARSLGLPLLLDKSARRESRGGNSGAEVNVAKASLPSVSRLYSSEQGGGQRGTRQSLLSALIRLTLAVSLLTTAMLTTRTAAAGTLPAALLTY